MDAKKEVLAQTIDQWVIDIIESGGGEEQLLEGMHAYMDTFHQLLTSCSPTEINLLIQRYDGFYRFAKLLEMVAQGLRDGVISAPKPPRKKKPRKPKPKRHKKTQAEPEQIRHPISYLPTFTELIIGHSVTLQEQYDAFAQVQDKPHVLDDETIERALKLHDNQLGDIAAYEKQLNWWLKDPITDAQRHQVNDLLSKLPPLRQQMQEMLELLQELQQGTINRILEMDDEELTLKILSGEMKPPF